MSWELHMQTPPLLKEGQYIKFLGDWPAQGDTLNGRWFKVDLAQQVKFDVNRIIPTGSSIDLDFSKPAGGGFSETQLSLLPERQGNVFELLLGFKGLPLVYPQYNNTFFLKLESTQVIPTLTNERGRYLGFWDEDDSPFDAPRLREYTVKDQEPPVLRIYNDMVDDDRIVLRFIVNRLKLVEVTLPSDDIQRVARVAKYHTLVNY